jgi:glycosyltransferase involved in cell wall biosynthesis
LGRTVDILFIHHLPIMGGATQSLLTLVKQAMAAGYECKVLFLRQDGNAIQRYRDEGIEVTLSNKIMTYAHAYGAYNSFISRRPWRVITNLVKTFASVDEAKNILSLEKPKVVYLNTSVLIPFAMAAKDFKLPVIWHLREQIHNGIFGIRKKMVQYLFEKYASSIIAISKVNASTLGLNNIQVVYNSVDLNQFDKELDPMVAKEKWSVKAPFVISFIGGKVLSKGADLLVASLLELLKIREDFQVLIAGDFNKDNPATMNKVEKKVYTMCSQNGLLKNKLIFTGVLPNVAEVIAASDVLIWPATTPHFARPIMEAMVMAKPVIASNFLSSAEIVEHEKEGLLVPPSPLSMANAILQMMNNRDAAKRMGQLAYEKARYLFDARVNNDRIVKEIKKYILAGS